MSHVYFLQLSNPFNCSLIPQGSGHDQTLDIWSVGILLYEMMVRNSATGMRWTEAFAEACFIVRDG